jgi:hypothetical protein
MRRSAFCQHKSRFDVEGFTGYNFVDNYSVQIKAGSVKKLIYE